MLVKKTRCERGATMFEAAAVLPLFLFIILAIMEFSLVAYSKLNIQSALSAAGRFMITGQGIDHQNVPPDPNARLAIIQSNFCQNLIAAGISCSNLSSHFSVSCVNPSVCTTPGQLSCPAGCTQPAGGPGQTVTVSVMYDKPWVSGLFKKFYPWNVSLRSSTTWKNEPYL